MITDSHLISFDTAHKVLRLPSPLQSFNVTHYIYNSATPGFPQSPLRSCGVLIPPPSCMTLRIRLPPFVYQLLHYNAPSLEIRCSPEATSLRLYTLMPPPPCHPDLILLPPLLCRPTFPFQITCGETAIGMASLGCCRDALRETRG